MVFAGIRFLIKESRQGAPYAANKKAKLYESFAEFCANLRQFAGAFYLDAGFYIESGESFLKFVVRKNMIFLVCWFGVFGSVSIDGISDFLGISLSKIPPPLLLLLGVVFPPPHFGDKTWTN